MNHDSPVPRLRRLVFGYTAGLALAVAASWLRVLLAGSLRIETATFAFFISSLLLGAGLGLAGFCGWRLIRASDATPAATLLRWAVPGHLIIMLAAPITSSDFYQYVAYGLLQTMGKNPLAYGPSALGNSPLLHWVAARWIDQPSLYGPVLLLLFRAAAWIGARIGAPLWGCIVVTKLFMAGSALATLALAARMLDARAHETPGTSNAFGFAVLAFSPLLAWEISAQGHVDGVLALALVCFVWAASQERELLAVLAIAAGTMCKLTLAPILALYLVFLLRRAPLRAIAFGAISMVLGAALMIPYRVGFPALGPMLSAVRGTRSHSLGDLLALVLTPLGTAAQELAVRCSFILCIALCGVVFATVVVRARTVPQLIRGSLVFLLAWDMTIPLFQTWYIVWLYPLAMVDPDVRWRRLIAIYGIWSVLQWTVQLDPVTTVAINGYVVWQVARLLKSSALEPSSAPDAAVLKA